MTKKQMRKKRKFLIIATAFLFLAFVAACLSHVPMMITASWPNGYVWLGLWVACAKNGGHKQSFGFRMWFFGKNTPLQSDVKKFKMINISAGVILSLGAIAALLLAIFILLHITKCLKMKKKKRKILNLCGAICTVVLLTTGCILVTVSMAPSTIPKSTLYTKVAALSVMGAASKAVNGQGGSTTVNWAFFMPWCALLFSLVAALMLLLILVMKAPLKKRRRRRTGRPKKGKK